MRQNTISSLRSLRMTIFRLELAVEIEILMGSKLESTMPPRSRPHYWLRTPNQISTRASSARPRSNLISSYTSFIKVSLGLGFKTPSNRSRPTRMSTISDKFQTTYLWSDPVHILIKTFPTQNFKLNKESFNLYTNLYYFLFWNVKMKNFKMFEYFYLLLANSSFCSN